MCEALGLPSGSLTHRAGPADQALAEALTEPGVLFLDDAQRLSPPVLDYLRQLWDSPVARLPWCCAGRAASGHWPGQRRCVPAS
ncbi:hypothetical protein H4K36_00045 [Streptomyces sp. DHE7-1]|nr:hypothetical protein [Streptomyces sp. DHE7-1]